MKEEIKRLILLAETFLGPAHRRDEGRVLISPRPPSHPPPLRNHIDHFPRLESHSI